MDVSPLEVLLGAGKWRAADEETRRLLLGAADTGGFTGIDPNEVVTLDCGLLLAIDDAWRAVSDGRFGFAAQAAVLSEVHSDGFSGLEAWRVFGVRTGWVQREWVDEVELAYDAEAPVGHLPWVFGTMPTVLTGRTFEVLFLFYKTFTECAAAAQR